MFCHNVFKTNLQFLYTRKVGTENTNFPISNIIFYVPVQLFNLFMHKNL